MDVSIIGKQIATMRKEKGLKQEELASAVNVTPQAVSKWENGSAPDIALLPQIADFFGVSIDYLLGRDMIDYTDLRQVVAKEFSHLKENEQHVRFFDYCWDIERACFGYTSKNEIKDFTKNIREADQAYSGLVNDFGFTSMGIGNRIQYFLLVPNIEDTDRALFDGIDYVAFLKDLSDKDVFDACVLLHKREHQKAFTSALLVKRMGVTVERAQQIIAILSRWHLIKATQIEMDDEVQTIYTFRPTHSFVALLIFAREMIDPPRHFSFHMDHRKIPYLK